MISQGEAKTTMLSHATGTATEHVGLADAVGRVLSADVQADMDMPPFVKAAMDGYACRRVDLGNELKVVAALKAGEAPDRVIGTNECAKIMTGGMVPEGADCVVMVEETEEAADGIIRFTAKSTRDNLCPIGEDMREGQVVLTAGTLLRPQQVAMLASVGCTSPEVAARPRVGIISTGDELVEPEIKPDISQIRTSNSHQLVAQVLTSGAVPTYYGIARDTEASLDSIIKQAKSENDVVLLSGGVSMGDFDLVPVIMKANGFRILFDEIAIQPGKPTTFSVADGSCCIGLPGNPVAAFTQFELLVKPFLYRMMGHDFSPANLRLPMATTHSRRRSVRESWFPATVTDEGGVQPCEFHGSAHVDALCEADCLGTMPAGVDRLEEGELVTIRML